MGLKIDYSSKVTGFALEVAEQRGGDYVPGRPDFESSMYDLVLDVDFRHGRLMVVK